METELLTYQQAASRLGITVRMVRRAVARRALQCVDLGHRTKRIRPVDLSRFLEKRTRKAI